MIKARVLLAIFVSTIVLSALHRHESVSTVAADCIECVHHVHHSHLATATTGIHDCLLCHYRETVEIPRQTHEHLWNLHDYEAEFSGDDEEREQDILKKYRKLREMADSSLELLE